MKPPTSRFFFRGVGHFKCERTARQTSQSTVSKGYCLCLCYLIYIVCRILIILCDIFAKSFWAYFAILHVLFWCKIIRALILNVFAVNLKTLKLLVLFIPDLSLHAHKLMRLQNAKTAERWWLGCGIIYRLHKNTWVYSWMFSRKYVFFP